MSFKRSSETHQTEHKILLVDDHPLLRRGLAALIEGELDLSVCGQAASRKDALRCIGQQQPDLAIVDLNLEGSDGLNLIKDIKACRPDVMSMVLSMHDESLYAERAIHAGARGYVSKQQLDDTILVAIRRILDGGIYLSEKMGALCAEKYLLGQARTQGLEDDSPMAALSDRELEVFQLIGSGESTREIAERLGLSIKTIESHREHNSQFSQYGRRSNLCRME